MANLVLLSYGRENEYKRAILSILSHYAWATPGSGAERVILFTDNPDYLRPYLTGLNVDYILLTAEKIQELKGPNNFVHSLKVAVVERGFQACSGENILFLDSDTFFFSDAAPLLARISPMVSIMDRPEYVVESRRHEAVGGALINLLEREIFLTSKGEEKFSSLLYSWNSGILGFHASVATYMSDIALLTEKFFAASRWHVSEQLAFSFVIQTRTQVIAADSVIYHYWQGIEKIAVDALLNKLLVGQFTELPLTDKHLAVRSFTQSLRHQMAVYLTEHPEVVLRDLKAQAIYSFQIRDFGAGYKYGLRYLRQNPTDGQFIRDLFYYTKQQLLASLDYTFKKAYVK